MSQIFKRKIVSLFPLIGFPCFCAVESLLKLGYFKRENTKICLNYRFFALKPCALAGSFAYKQPCDFESLIFTL